MKQWLSEQFGGAFWAFVAMYAMVALFLVVLCWLVCAKLNRRRAEQRGRRLSERQR